MRGETHSPLPGGEGSGVRGYHLEQGISPSTAPTHAEEQGGSNGAGDLWFCVQPLTPGPSPRGRGERAGP